jgi:hypothetical protein
MSFTSTDSSVAFSFTVISAPAFLEVRIIYGAGYYPLMCSSDCQRSTTAPRQISACRAVCPFNIGRGHRPSPLAAATGASCRGSANPQNPGNAGVSDLSDVLLDLEERDLAGREDSIGEEGQRRVWRTHPGRCGCRALAGHAQTIPTNGRTSHPNFEIDSLAAPSRRPARHRVRVYFRHPGGRECVLLSMKRPRDSARAG